MKAFLYSIEVLSKLFAVAEGIPVVGRILDIWSSSMAMILRATSGAAVAEGSAQSKRPQKLLRLYDFEACPFCRKVREALSHLDLDVEIRPCPKEAMNATLTSGTSRFRSEVKKMGLPLQFPVLVDENTGTTLQDSEKIVEYLWKTYGDKAQPALAYRLGRMMDFMPVMALPSLMRPMLNHGMLRVPSKAPEQQLELFSFEASPFARFVREALCCLEIPYICRNVAHNSEAKRKDFRRRFGGQLSGWRKSTFDTTIQVPFLIDPNTKTELLESSDIVAYLYQTYQQGPQQADSWLNLKMNKKPIADTPKSK